MWNEWGKASDVSAVQYDRVAVPELFGLSSIAEKLTSILLGLFVIIGLGLLYRYAPHRSQAQFKWISWGAVMATMLWMVVSMLHSPSVNAAPMWPIRSAGNISLRLHSRPSHPSSHPFP